MTFLQVPRIRYSSGPEYVELERPDDTEVECLSGRLFHIFLFEKVPINSLLKLSFLSLRPPRPLRHRGRAQGAGVRRHASEDTNVTFSIL